MTASVSKHLADQIAAVEKHKAEILAAEEARKKEMSVKVDDKIKRVEKALHDKVVDLVAKAGKDGSGADPEKSVNEALKNVVTSETTAG